MPPIDETITDIRLKGKYTPVKTELIFKIINAPRPESIDKKALLKGFLFLPILCIIPQKINADTKINTT